MRRRLTYANVAATLALVFSMTGGALAANHYLINSTKQISPKVLKKLKGATGKTGVNGAAGAQGVAGKEGAAGKEGKEGPQGPSSGYQAFNDGLGTITGASTTLGKLAVPPGSYLVTAKVWFENQSAARQKVTCTLTNSVNGDSDRTDVTMEPIGSTSYFGRAVVSLEAASKFASTGSWLVNCSGNGNAEIEANNLKIHAIQVGSLSNSNA